MKTDIRHKREPETEVDESKTDGDESETGDDPETDIEDNDHTPGRSE